MKQYLLSLFLLSAPLSASVSINTNWEVRSTGNDLNGGGFVFGATGTDFSQQDAPQFSFADLASANASTTCAVTSASHNFAATDVGNIIHISAGTNWTIGWYQIVSAAANAATLDRACGSVASVSGGTWREGGGFATIQAAINNGPDSTSAMGLAGGTFSGVIWIKSGTYTLTSTITETNYSIAFVGYDLTHGDFDGTRPTVTTATNGVVLWNNEGHNYTLDNINFTTTAATPNWALNGNNANGNLLVIRNCTFTGFSNAINNVNAVLYLINVEIKNSTADAITTATSGSTFVLDSYIHNNTGNGLTISTQNSGAIINSIISNNAIGVTTSTIDLCINSTIANNTSDGWKTSGGDALLNNCILYGNGGFGLNGITSGAINENPFQTGLNNAFGSNTSGNHNGSGFYPGLVYNTNAGQGDVALTANPFTSSTNFALNSTAGGGAAINTQGFPGTFPGGSTIGSLAIGAVQNNSGGGGAGSGLLYIITVR